MIYLYQACELNRQYHNVFRTQALLETYLSGLTSITVDADSNSYFEYKGTLSLALPLYTTACNYMKYTDSAGNANYYFITEWNIKNGIYILSYVIDIWHTFIYDDYWKVHYGHQIATHNFTHDRLYMIGEPEYKQPLTCTQVMPTGDSDYHYSIIFFGYRYTGVTDLSGPSYAVQEAFIDYDNGWNGYQLNMALYRASVQYSTLVGGSVTNGSDTWYFNVTSMYIVPTELLPSSISGTIDTIQLATSNLTPYRQINVTEQYTSIANYEFYGNYDFSSGQGLLYMGTINHLRTVPQVYNASTRVGYSVKLYLTSTGISILGLIGENVDDITQDFAYDVNYTAESALAAVNRNIAAKADITAKSTSVAKSIISGAANIYSGVGNIANQNAYMNAFLASGNSGIVQTSYTGGVNQIASGINDFIDAGNTIAQCIYNRQYQYSDVKPSGSTIDISKLYYGITVFYQFVNNAMALNAARTYYGMICDEYITEIENSGNNFDLILCDDIDIVGKIPSQFAKLIEEILTNGVRVWNQSTIEF